MGLWVEEHLYVDNILVRDPGEIGHRQVVEVRLIDEDAHAFVVLG